MNAETTATLPTSYAECFIGREAVDWPRARRGLAMGEAQAVGQRLLELGIIHHVLDERGFSDAAYFYRFRADGAMGRK